MPSLDEPHSSSAPQTGSQYSPAGDTPDGAASGRYGRIGVVPWSLAETIRGLALTLAPWYAYIFASQLGTAPSKDVAPLTRQVDLTRGITVVVVTALIEGVFLIAPLYYALKRRVPGTSLAEGLHSLGFRRTPIGASLLPVAASLAAVFAASYLYAAIVSHFSLGLQTNVQGLLDLVRIEPITVICTLFGAVFVAPLCEEVFFRGFAFAGLLRGINAVPAALLSAVFFTLAHGDLGSAAPLFILGLLLANLRWRSGSIWPSIALHMSNNLIAALFVLATLLGH